MGFMSRRVLPVCGSMCVCCPALRSRSRQPVKRYKKLLADIFPKQIDESVNERKIVKLCEYASKNPIRIPKIVKYLEQRSNKELRSEHINSVRIIIESYNKLLCMCKEQMVYFAASLLNVILQLIDNTRSDVKILGCQTLTHFINSQVDGTYAHNIERLVSKICMIAGAPGEEHDKFCLRASSLQCLSSMIWFMGEFSHIAADFDEIVNATLHIYEMDNTCEDHNRGESQHHWVDEVIRCELKGDEPNYNHVVVRPPPERKDPSTLTSEEIASPKTWAQICIQKMVELAKESTTMRRVLEPMFVYFDKRIQWSPRHGLALPVLSDMSYLVGSGKEHLIFAAIIRHLDHKNVVHDPLLKADIVQIASSLARQVKSHAIFSEIGTISDLGRHLRKSLQATIALTDQQELHHNISLQNAVKDCLLVIAKGVGDPQPLLDMMVIMLEKLPMMGVTSRAVIGSMYILADIISSTYCHSASYQTFPEALLLHLLKAMIHPDLETRVAAHRVFSVLLIPSSNRTKHQSVASQSDYLYKQKIWQSKSSCVVASATALLEKLRFEKDGAKPDKHSTDTKERELIDEFRYGQNQRNPHVPEITTFSGETIQESRIKLTEEQTSQLLSSLWIQANLPDNLPPNYAAIVHSFNLTLVSSHLKDSNCSILRSFQLPLSLRNASLDLKGLLPSYCRRSLFTCAKAMLMFAAKTCHLPELNDLLNSLSFMSGDTFLTIGDDYEVYVIPEVDIREYGSYSDQESAIASLNELRKNSQIFEKDLVEIIIPYLSSLTKMTSEEVAVIVSETFTLDEAFLFGAPSLHYLEITQTVEFPKRNLSSDEETTSSSMENDMVNESTIPDKMRFAKKNLASTLSSEIISVGQLLESALKVAGCVAGSSASTSPLPYSAMASQCESLGTDTRQKLSIWLSHYPKANKESMDLPVKKLGLVRNINCDESLPCELTQEPWLTMRLPPASPFDNFLKAVGC